MKRGEGRLRGLESGRMCLVLGEVRKGRVDLCCVWVSGAVLMRTVYITDFGIRRILLQVVLLFFTNSLPGGKHVCHGRLMTGRYGESRVV